MQGLADHALNVVKAMRADGLEASTVVLNSLMNAFGEDRRVVEAFSVLQFMKENVSDISCSPFLVSCPTSYHYAIPLELMKSLLSFARHIAGS